MPRIFVGNLNFATRDGDLEQLFVKHGTVVSCVVRREGNSDRSKGFGYVEMADPIEAQAAVSKLSGYELHGNPLMLKIVG